MVSVLSDPLNVAAIVDALGEGARRMDVTVLDCCESSNAELLLAPPGQPGNLRALAVENQTAGRGRRGRSWQSWPDASLLFSVRQERPPLARNPAGLSLAAGLAVAATLENFGCRNLKLKWPNDLLIDGGKAGGILVELTQSGAKQAVVIGVGLNLRLPDEAGVSPDMRALFAHLPRPPSRNLLLAHLLQARDQMLAAFDQHGFSFFAERWNARNAHANAEVLLLGEGTTQAGRCLGVDTDGALLLETSAGLLRVLSGDVSLRSSQ